MSHRILNIVAIIFLLATLQIHASFLGGRSSTSKMLEKLQNPKFVRQNGFDSLLMSTIQLKLKSLGKLDEVLDLLSQMETDLSAEQAQADSDYSEKNVLWTSSLSDLEAQISDVEAEITNNEQRILELQTELSQLNENLEQFQEQQATFTQKRANLVEARENDLAAFTKRVSDQQAMLDAIENILDLLQAKLSSSSSDFAEIDESFNKNVRKLKEMKSPYANLVSLTMSFDPEVVQEIMNKLNTIATAIQASIAEDNEKEEQAEIDYQNFLDSIDETLAAIAENIKETQNKITDNTFELNEKQIELANNKDLLDSLNSQKTDIEKERDVYNAAYDKDTLQRNYERNTLAAATEILENHESSISEAESLSS